MDTKTPNAKSADESDEYPACENCGDVWNPTKTTEVYFTAEPDPKCPGCGHLWEAGR